MSGQQDEKGKRDLTAWLMKDDAKSRPMRVTRLQDLLDVLPVPSEGLNFFGGEESLICFDEARRCYLDGSNLAVVLLCLAYVERELATELYTAGWAAAKSARLRAVLDEAYERGLLPATDWRTFHPTLTLAHACRRGSGGGGTENQGVMEVIARYRPELHRYMYVEWRACMSKEVRVILDTCICASPTRSAPTAPC